MKKHLLKLVLFCFATISLGNVTFSQSKIIDISFKNLKKSNPEYLKKVFHLKEGEEFTVEKVEEGLARLETLDIFKSVEYSVKDSLGGKKVIITCKESSSISPLLSGGQIEGKPWFRLGVQDINLNGEGIKAGAYYQFFDNNSFKFFVEMPYLNNTKWGFGLTAQKLVSFESVFFKTGPIDYIYDNNGYIGELFRKDGYHTFNFGLEFHQDQFVSQRDSLTIEDSNALTLSSAAFQRLLFRPSYTLNKVSKKKDFYKGIYFQSELIAGLVQNPREFILSFENEAHYYLILGKKTNIAMQLELELSSNHVNIEQSFFIDDEVKIRHSATRAQRGTAGITYNFELRNQWLDKEKWGIQSVLFADLGVWRPAGEKISSMFENARVRESFLGAGVRVRTPFVTLRFDYGYDIWRSEKPGFSFGVGQFF